MHIRQPAVAGAFYPQSAADLKRTIEKFLSQAKAGEKEVIAAVSPHAGYAYCGKTMAAVYKSIAKKFDTVVIIGINHAGFGLANTSSGMWQTPFGNIAIDEIFTKELASKSKLITEDYRAHSQEHSIEVQLPWIQYIFKTVKFVPLSINPKFSDIKTCREVGTAIAEAAKALKRKPLIIASSDFTHYGSAYGYTPFKGGISQILKGMEKIDLEAAGYATKLMPERFIEFCEGTTICGCGAVAAALYAARALGAKSGELVDYSTSFEVSRNSSAIVGYCGVVIV